MSLALPRKSSQGGKIKARFLVLCTAQESESKSSELKTRGVSKIVGS